MCLGALLNVYMYLFLQSMNGILTLAMVLKTMGKTSMYVTCFSVFLFYFFNFFTVLQSSSSSRRSSMHYVYVCFSTHVLGVFKHF